MSQNPPIPGHHGKLFLPPPKKPYIKPSFCPVLAASCLNRGRHPLVSFSVILLSEVSFCEWLCGIPCLPTVGIPFPSELQHLHWGRGGLSPHSCKAYRPSPDEHIKENVAQTSNEVSFSLKQKKNPLTWTSWLSLEDTVLCELDRGDQILCSIRAWQTEKSQTQNRVEFFGLFSLSPLWEPKNHPGVFYSLNLDFWVLIWFDLDSWAIRES